LGRFHSDPSIWLLGKVGILFRSNADKDDVVFSFLLEHF
jgi:hypothetical protein